MDAFSSHTHHIISAKTMAARTRACAAARPAQRCMRPALARSSQRCVHRRLGCTRQRGQLAAATHGYDQLRACRQLVARGAQAAHASATLIRSTDAQMRTQCWCGHDGRVKQVGSGNINECGHHHHTCSDIRARHLKNATGQQDCMRRQTDTIHICCCSSIPRAPAKQHRCKIQKQSRCRRHHPAALTPRRQARVCTFHAAISPAARWYRAS